MQTMVLGVFWEQVKRCALLILEHEFESKKLRYTTNSCLKILEEGLASHISDKRRFMHNNTPIYTAKRVTDWFTEHCVVAIEWSLYSVDLNPMKHV